MEIRKDKAQFLDNLLKVFNNVRCIRKKDLEIKYKNDYFMFVQIEKHLKILEDNGIIRSTPLDEYYLEPRGIKVLNGIEDLGYLDRHKKEEAEWQKLEDEEEDEFSFSSDLPALLLSFFNQIFPRLLA